MADEAKETKEVTETTETTETPEVPETPSAEVPASDTSDALSTDQIEDLILDDADDLDFDDGESVAADAPAPTPDAAPVTDLPAPETPPVEPAPVVPATETLPAPATPEPLAPGTAPAATPLTPEQLAAAAPEQSTAVTPEAAPVVPQDPATIQAEANRVYQENRATIEQALATEHYALTDEQVRQLDDGDNSIIPTMMSRVYMDAVTAGAAHMMTQLPALIEQVLAARDNSSNFEAQFYEGNAHLNAEEHGATISRFGQVYRQLNPNAPTADFIRDVGAQVSVALGIAPNAAPAANGGAVPVVPVVPVVDPVTNASVVPPVAPFIPAQAGSRAGDTAPERNVFDKLTEDMENSDLDLD